MTRKVIDPRWKTVQELHSITGVSVTTIYAYKHLGLLKIKPKSPNSSKYLVDTFELPDSFKCRYLQGYYTPAQFRAKWKVSKDEYELVMLGFEDLIIQCPKQLHRQGHKQYLKEETVLPLFLKADLWSDPKHPFNLHGNNFIVDSDAPTSTSRTHTKSEEVETKTDENESPFIVSFKPPQRFKVTLVFDSEEERNEAMNKQFGITFDDAGDQTLYISKGK